jgi:2-hydroxychromene-2-carboxylate isomerase
MSLQIDYFFGIASPWAYIGHEVFIDLAKKHGLTVMPHVVPLIVENGAIYSKDRPQARRDYWLKDLSRWADLRSKVLDFEKRAKVTDPAPANDLVTAAAHLGADWSALTTALQHALWVEGDNIGDAQVRIGIANSIGLDGKLLEETAQSAEIQALKAASFDYAKSQGVFGLPSYLIEGELYWGQDSLPFIERHLQSQLLAAE